MLRRLLCLLAILTVTALAQQKPISAAAPPTEETVNAFMHDMFGYDDTLTWKVIDIRPSEAEGLTEVTVAISGPQGQQVNKFYVTADGQHAVTGEIIAFGVHPFAANLKALEKANGPSRGPANASLVLVEFSDLQCPHCKEAQPSIDKLLAAEPNARLVFQNFPLPSHDWAAKAAAYADCIGQTPGDAFWKFIQGTYDQQADITTANADEKLTALANTVGAKGAEIAACAAKPETAARVERSIALGKEVGVSSTPTLFINGRKMGNPSGIPDDKLKSLADFAAKQGQ
jgi:protein-disulfide isomerase